MKKETNDKSELPALHVVQKIVWRWRSESLCSRHFPTLHTHTHAHTLMHRCKQAHTKNNIEALCGQSRWGQMGRQRGGASLRQDVPGCSKTSTFLYSLPPLCSTPAFLFLFLFCSASVEITNRWNGVGCLSTDVSECQSPEIYKRMEEWQIVSSS